MQGAGNAAGAEFSVIRNYIASRLLWDPNLSSEALLDEFLRLHYGKGAPGVRKFIDVLHDSAKRKGVEKNCFGYPEDYGVDAQVAEAGLRAFAEALAAAENETVRNRIEKASIWAHRAAVGRMTTRLSSLMRGRWNRGEQRTVKPLDPATAKRSRPHLRRLLQLCKKHNVTQWSEAWTIEQALPVLRQFFGLYEDEAF